MGANSTIQAADQIDGGAGVNTAKLYYAATAGLESAVLPSMKNIQNLELNGGKFTNGSARDFSTLTPSWCSATTRKPAWPRQQEPKPEPAPAPVAATKPEPAPAPVAAPKPEPAPKPDPAAKAQPAKTDWAPSGMMYRDVYKYAAEHITAGYTHRNFDPPTGPKLDSAIAVRLAVCNYTQGQITAAIAAGSPAASASSNYATTKAAEPFSANQAQVTKYAARAQDWRKEEKKDVIQAQREYSKNGIAVPAGLKQGPKQNKGMSM